MDTRMILLDVGGTFIKCDDGRQVPIVSGGSKQEIADALRQAVGDTAVLGRIGVAIPGPFDYRNGIFLMKHKFASVFGEDFRDIAGIPGTVEIKYEHDVTAVLRGAVRMMDLHDSNCALVTLGTGLGYACALHGEVQYDPSGSPSRSLWNQPWENGILEDILSGRGIRSAYAGKTGDCGQTAYTVAKLAYDGAAAAIETYREAGEVLGQALAHEVKELGLDTLLMGGQISKSLSLMLEPLQADLPGVRILPSPLGAVFEGLRSLFD
ncbi:MAG: ROK family protein [Bacteroidales bacterium]|nr:ROK family protein [Bacteroidales bacterium]